MVNGKSTAGSMKLMMIWEMHKKGKWSPSINTIGTKGWRSQVNHATRRVAREIEGLYGGKKQRSICGVSIFIVFNTLSYWLYSILIILMISINQFILLCWTKIYLIKNSWMIKCFIIKITMDNTCRKIINNWLYGGLRR